MKKIAIIGGGIAGMATARFLSNQYRVSLFEANDYIGGHTNTEDVEVNGEIFPVNTGFIVFNDRNYPLFEKLMAELPVEAEKTVMSFSVKDAEKDLEWNGRDLSAVFAQKRNLFNPKFLKMLWNIVRFNKQAQELLAQNAIPADLSLGDFFKQHGYSGWFIDKYILPMGSAIWSSGETDMQSFQALFFIRFFFNHGLLSLSNRPQWYTLKGGSRSYVEPLIEPFKDRVFTSRPVKTIERFSDHVRIHFEQGDSEDFDEVVLACHSDQALALLAEPTAEEKSILGALPYADNEVVLHTDQSLLPKRKKAWAAWNYHIGAGGQHKASVSYCMNLLQNFKADAPTFVVTLNNSSQIDPDKIIKTFHYAHPVFTTAGQLAQQAYHQIGNRNHTHFAGAYWFNGFHEDGVKSALRVANDLGVQWP